VEISSDWLARRSKSTRQHQEIVLFITSSLESYYILFITYLRYYYASGKSRYTYIGFFFRKVGYTRYDVAGFIELMHFT
jgi:hypothetical protein